ncbi:hypothetical protein LWI28_024127 [Acer negundo]|uniref:Uncharacterized protein n=1 Tax=Acer negundo TaxID=4023 RepID=A0AAD5JBU4_ACENE|nr:hypothetical protein LWI28_024127 [Acer negundo]
MQEELILLREKLFLVPLVCSIVHSQSQTGRVQGRVQSPFIEHEFKHQTMMVLGVTTAVAAAASGIGGDAGFFTKIQEMDLY